MKLGIVGLAGSGKTTIFNALTRREGESAPTAGQSSPVLGVVSVPDARLDWLSALYKPEKTTPAQITYMDLQGMHGVVETRQEYVAHLLNHMRPMDAFLMVVRNFDDPVAGPPDVRRDVRELEEEFVLTDLASVEKRVEKLAMELKRGRKEAAVEMDLLQKCLAVLNEERPLRTEPELARAPELRGFTFLSAKPVLVVVNNTDDDEALPAGFTDAEKAIVVRGKLEMEVAQLDEEEAAVFREDFGIKESALDRVIRGSFDLLNVATFFTVGEDECKAWTISVNLAAQEAAGVIHSDIQRGFIRAEVVAYEDLKKAGDYAAARKLGTVRLEGKTYPVKDGDVIHFRFNV